MRSSICEACARVPRVEPQTNDRWPARDHGQTLTTVGRSRGSLVRDEGCDGSAGRGETRRAPAQQRAARRRAGRAAPGAKAARPATAGRGANGIRAADAAMGGRAGNQDLPKMRWPDAAGGLDLAEVRFVPRVALRQLQGKGHGPVAAVQGTPEANPRPGRGAAADASRPLRSHTRAGAARSAANRGPHRSGADTTAPPLPPGPAPVAG